MDIIRTAAMAGIFLFATNVLAHENEDSHPKNPMFDYSRSNSSRGIQLPSREEVPERLEHNPSRKAQPLPLNDGSSRIEKWDGYGLGTHVDQYGRPVQIAPKY